MKIKKGDTVKIITGKDRTKAGVVLSVSPDFSKVTVQGLNLYRKRVRSKKQGQSGEVVSIPKPLQASNVMLVCSSCGKATRIGARFKEDLKVRYCKKCRAAT